MAIGGSFDRWQKDVFFSAAEEVQESADVMLSVYRIWIRRPMDGFDAEASDELWRELQIALGTAKWQLDEFERAVKLSHDSCSVEENTIHRHMQFITAIENQILQVEKELTNSISENQKQPFRWVQLDKEERNDLAIFLSGKLGNGHERQAEAINYDSALTKVKTNMDNNSIFKDTTGDNKSGRCIVEVSAKESFESKNAEGSIGPEQSNELKNSSSLGTEVWKIVVADNEDTRENLVEDGQEPPKRSPDLCHLLRSLEFTSKLKWFKNSYRKAKTEARFPPGHDLSNYLDKRVTWFAQGINGLTERSRNCYSSCTEERNLSVSQQLYGKGNLVPRNIQGSQFVVQFTRTLQVTFLVILSIVLIVPFVLYST